MTRLTSMLALFTVAIALLLSGAAQAQGCVCVTIWKRRRNGKGTTKTITKCGSPDFFKYSHERRDWPSKRYKCCIIGLGAFTKKCYRETRGRVCGGYSQPGPCPPLGMALQRGAAVLGEVVRNDV